LREDAQGHIHRSAPPDRRVWLEAIPDVAATMRLHSFCAECGTIRLRVQARGRPLGFFQQALSNLKANLDSDARYPKLAQVQSHLISNAVESIPDFGDEYSMAFEVQRGLFASAVRRCRPDLDENFILQALPREPRRPRDAFLSVASQVKEEAGRVHVVTKQSRSDQPAAKVLTPG
jgi:hypothetical protein